MSRQGTLFATATRYALLEHARNRFATLLAAVYVPLGIVLVFLTVRQDRVTFVLQATGRRLAPHGNEVTVVTTALSSVSLITGFAMFAATLSGSAFDRRLALAGYPRVHLALAKIAALVVAAVVVTVYATGVICALWPPRQVPQLAAALLCCALTYGALGVALGSLLRKEVEGMFVIALTSTVDMALQNPVASSGANSPVIRCLPSYGGLQSAMAASFSTTALPWYLVLQLCWFGAMTLVCLYVFHRRTRSALRAGNGSGDGARTGSRHRDVGKRRRR
jgi:hypothetical protein